MGAGGAGQGLVRGPGHQGRSRLCRGPWRCQALGLVSITSTLRRDLIMTMDMGEPKAQMLSCHCVELADPAQLCSHCAPGSVPREQKGRSTDAELSLVQPASVGPSCVSASS